MKKLLCALGLALLPAAAELPPLRPEDRLAQSSHVVVGIVESVSVTPEIIRLGYVNNNYSAVLRVSQVTKGVGVKPGSKLKITWWDSAIRPHGWAGPGGQYNNPEKASKGRFYLTRGKGGYALLTPNGWDPL